jgi:dienelactone hydrolase
MSRIAHFTRSLREQSRLGSLAGVPALFAHPDLEQRAPLLLWLHGRTANKEIDSARYLRLIRSGVAILALDLPGHGEREDPQLMAPEGMKHLLSQAIGEIDGVLQALWASEWGPLVHRDRLAMGGMSGGGMVTLRRLCDPHPFRCVVVESTSGDFGAVGQGRFLEAQAFGLDPRQHIAGWRPIPLLAMHSETDEITPLAGIQSFVEALRDHYAHGVSDPESVQLVTWPETGAPAEHAGFGKKSRQAREHLIAFLGTHL